MQGRSFTSIHADSLIVPYNPETVEPVDTNTSNAARDLDTLGAFIDPNAVELSESNNEYVYINDRRVLDNPVVAAAYANKSTY